MTKKHRRTSMALGAVTTCLLLNMPLAMAEERPVFKLDEIMVTASRYEKTDIDIPASTEVLTAQQLEDSGAQNLQQALGRLANVVSETSAPGGNAINPFSNNEINIRGVANGTLVLVNGVPLNLNERYNLNDIPIEEVERVEIIKSGGAVLYGSQATAGVINIITKKERANSIKVGLGNYGQQSYALNTQAGKFGFGYNYDKWGDVNNISLYNDANGKSKYNNTKGSEKNNFNANYRFNDNWNLMYTHNESKSAKEYIVLNTGVTEHEYVYNTKKDYLQLQYQDADVKGTLYYNVGYLDSDKLVGVKHTLKTEKNKTYGGDLQKKWNIGDGTLLFGGSYQNEFFNADEVKGTAPDYTRNVLALYGQWEKPLSEKDTMIIGLRETWTANETKGNNKSNLSGSGQFIHKITEDESVYASVTQTFKLPTFKQLYGSVDSTVVGNSDVKPETGVNYEIGWKKNSGDHKWKAALFNIDIKDNITTTYNSRDEKYTYTNEDFKNYGLELSCNIEEQNGFTYQYGLTIQNPTIKKIDKDGATNGWQSKYGKFQLNSAISYAKDKWRATLTANYLAGRNMLSSSSSGSTKPYLLTTLDVNYAMDKNSSLNLTIDNLLDRRDNTNHTGTYYYTTPINYLLSYNYKF